MRTLICMLLMTAGAVAAEPELPRLLSDQPADVDTTFGGINDDVWRSDVEAALMYLAVQQTEILTRLDAIEATQIRVSTDAGPVVRSVPVAGGAGRFYLAPGEKLLGWQDPITQQWTSAETKPATVIRYQNESVPIRAHVSPYIELRTQTVLPPVQTYTRGDIRIRQNYRPLMPLRQRSQSCRMVNGVRVCN